MPSSPSDSGKTVSAAESAPGDGTPPESDLGLQTAQMAEGDGHRGATEGTAPGALQPGGGHGDGPAAGPADKQA